LVTEVQAFSEAVEDAWAGEEGGGGVSPVEQFRHRTGLSRRNPVFWLLLTVAVILDWVLAPPAWLWRRLTRR
jgi:hypothetical protein